MGCMYTETQKAQPWSIMYETVTCVPLSISTMGRVEI